MRVWLVLLFLLVPLAEFWIVLQVADRLGILPTIAILVIDSLLGAYLVRREGMGAWQRIRQQLSQAKAPTDSVIDGVLIVAAGALMLTPGFLTDIVGLLLLFPPSRIPLRTLLKKRFGGALVVGGGPSAGFGGFQVFGSGGAGPSASSTRQPGPGPRQDDQEPFRRTPFGTGGNRGGFIDGHLIEDPPNGGATGDDVIDGESWEEPPDNPRLGQ